MPQNGQESVSCWLATSSTGWAIGAQTHCWKVSSQELPAVRYPCPVLGGFQGWGEWGKMKPWRRTSGWDSGRSTVKSSTLSRATLPNLGLLGCVQVWDLVQIQGNPLEPAWFYTGGKGTNIPSSQRDSSSCSSQYTMRAISAPLYCMLPAADRHSLMLLGRKQNGANWCRLIFGILDKRINLWFPWFMEFRIL